jgi:predicted AAA+ superfamily ATPase
LSTSWIICKVSLSALADCPRLDNLQGWYRRVVRSIEAALARQAAVAITGPRQIGKTTVAFSILDTIPGIYLDLEAPSDRAKIAADPELLLKSYEDRLVVFDEIQRVPELVPCTAWNH